MLLPQFARGLTITIQVAYRRAYEASATKVTWCSWSLLTARSSLLSMRLRPAQQGSSAGSFSLGIELGEVTMCHTARQERVRPGRETVNKISSTGILVSGNL